MTTEGGLDVVAQVAAVKDFTRQMHDAGIRVSVFLDPDGDQVRAAKSAGAEAVEINTGRYAEDDDATEAELARIAEAAALAARQDLEVLAGHGLNYTNVRRSSPSPRSSSSISVTASSRVPQSLAWTAPSETWSRC